MNKLPSNTVSQEYKKLCDLLSNLMVIVSFAITQVLRSEYFIILITCNRT